MTNFKNWLRIYEEAAPGEYSVSVFGKQAASPEEFDKISKAHIKQKQGYSDKEMDQLEKDDDIDDYWNPMFDAQAWSPKNSPYEKHIYAIIKKLAGSHGMRPDVVYHLTAQDPIAHSLFKQIHRPDVTEKDVENFLGKLEAIVGLYPSERKFPSKAYIPDDTPERHPEDHPKTKYIGPAEMPDIKVNSTPLPPKTMA